MPFAVIHVDISVIMLMESMSIFIPAISSSLFSMWFCFDTHLLCIGHDLACILYTSYISGFTEPHTCIVFINTLLSHVIFGMFVPGSLQFHGCHSA